MLPEFKNEPGWHGAFTRNQELGAWRNGTPVVKVNSEAGDTHPNGTAGVILGSLSHPEVNDGQIMYFVEW